MKKKVVHFKVYFQNIVVFILQHKSPTKVFNRVPIQYEFRKIPKKKRKIKSNNRKYLNTYITCLH